MFDVYGGAVVIVRLLVKSIAKWRGDFGRKGMSSSAMAFEYV